MEDTINIARVGDVDLAYESFGDETHDTILLIAGLGTQMIRWTTSFCEALATKGFRVIRFDNRDVGYSSHLNDRPAPDLQSLVTQLMSGKRPEVPYTLREMALDALGLLDALGIERAHVVGRSMGGMIAQIIASDYPDRVLSLTSIMSSSGNPALPQAAPDVFAMMAGPSKDPREDETGFLRDALAFARRIAGAGYPFDEAACRVLLLEEVRRAYDPAGFKRQLAATATAGDRRAALASVATPTLVIHGSSDPLILPACGEDTAASIPGAEFMLIMGMGHDLPAALDQTIIEAIMRVASRKKRVST